MRRTGQRWIRTGVTGIYIFLISVLLCGLFSPVSYAKAEEAAGNTYTVKPGSTPYQKKYQSSSTYNSKTRQYYMLRSYLELLEKQGGGKLVLSEGTYQITNTLNISSGITLILKDGVKLVKSNDTGTKALAPTSVMLQLIAPGKAGRTSAAAGYQGEHGITIQGEGSASIDLNYSKDATGIVIGHNSDIIIRGISFQRMNNGSFIKIGASRRVTIQDNRFSDHKASSTGSKEAIAIETPDTTTGTFLYSWSKADRTICKDITIKNNEFTKLERAVGSFKYTEGKYHCRICIQDNVITSMTSCGIRMLNWEDSTISSNRFSGIRSTKDSLKGVYVSGAKNPTITRNTFNDVDRAIQILPWKNTNSGAGYAITYNSISEENKAAILSNTLADMDEYFIRYNKTYNEFTQDTEKWEIVNASLNSFTLSPTSEPFQNKYSNFSTYTPDTRMYYVLRSYLEQLEKTGGGTLILTSGTYDITNALHVPSHVTINLKDGAVLRKKEQTGTTQIESSKAMFHLAAPSKAAVAGAYSGYGGETDIKFIGEGSAAIDLNYVDGAIGIMFGHNTEVTVKGIRFRNMYGGHFIELDASRNILIENNSFEDHKASESGIKEAINIDTPDSKTGGFHATWTSYDCTPDLDVVIQKNSFRNLERAVGTHKYSEDKYHENIRILNNNIENTSSDAIRILNWKNPVIMGNHITNVNMGQGTERAVLASGVIHPVITGNYFTNVPRPIQLMPWKNNGTGSEYAITYNEVNADEISLMLKNYLKYAGETFIRVNRTYGVYTSDTLKYYYTSEYMK